MYLIMHAEVYKNGEWQRVGRQFKSAHVEMKSYMTDRPCDERNYVLFEILTGKHLKQNDKLTKIDPVNFLELDDAIMCVSLEDIMHYNWSATISKVGVISEWQYKHLKHDGVWPANLNRSVLNRDAKVVSPFEMDMILNDESLRDNSAYYVRFEYDAHKIVDECKFFCSTTIPALMRLTPDDGDYNDVRIVYTCNES